MKEVCEKMAEEVTEEVAAAEAVAARATLLTLPRRTLLLFVNALHR